jgi:hypothetical protein
MIIDRLQPGDKVVTDGIYYSIAEIAAFTLPGFPRSKKGWYTFVERNAWIYRDVEGKGGRGGMRREYTPPPEVQALIDARQRGEQLPTPRKPGYKPSPAGAAAIQRSKEIEAMRMAAMAMPPPSATNALFDQQVVIWAEPAIQMAFIVRAKPQFAKASEDMLRRVALFSFRFVYLYCDGNLQHINQWLSDPAKTDGMIRLAYEGDCIKRGVAPGSDLNPDPNEYSF